MKGIKDKVVLITGSADGIGAAAAKRFYDEGANLVLADLDEKRLLNTAKQFEPSRICVQLVDISDPKQVQDLVKKAVSEFGKLDVLINNAGVHVPGSVVDCSVEDWQKIRAVDIDGVVYCAKFALPELIKTKGCIVNTASVSGLGGDWGAAFYCAAKGAVVNLTRAMALDHGLDGVRINAVCPSLVKTKMTNGWPDDVRAKFNERIALGRAAEPSEVAAVMAFLASDDASFINGVNLPVDGGATASDGQPKIV
ncbi:SDR family NAD(P)-dependent oxidoreductase [Celerinatantimonas sp. MCCC 1A17872]|uniref:SDR family NAD(P)-dependent oxidoreductase n=1 Tax=Celerinatantimonas sp. MCCC 1A17872 TaxID=3177514 RepID=UPI0038C1D52D